uniref:Replication-associated protein n=1 Tax=Fringilla montifringilla CRESS-DNA-virus sp. TaxID=2815044 RepID=A0A8A4XC06_9VIRU|nr:MAG: replication-associated protein [Fringilla montifringilla CRESS-DNA-virus sp.]
MTSRSYLLTCNNWQQADYDALIAEKYDYKIISKEVGKKSKIPHLHCFIYKEGKIAWKGLKKRNPRCDIRLCKGTAQENQTYVAKDGVFEEFGECPKQGKRNDLNLIKEEIQAGKTMREIIEVATNYQSLRTAELLLKYIEKKRDFKTEVIYIWGKSESGKTRYAYDNNPDVVIHQQMASSLKWWQGYDAHEIVIIDEVDCNTDYSMLKALCDRYPYVVETKGGSRQFLAKKLYITSLTDPKILFQYHPEEGKEMLRRIDKIIHLK